MRVPGHIGILGNEAAERGDLMPFSDLKPMTADLMPFSDRKPIEVI